ncbi:MAG: hypothetical protein K8F90_18960, partial [Hyphomicrobiales bacterium]|nr:hypothetical protein [Hyphomicrobiales bacterium]
MTGMKKVAVMTVNDRSPNNRLLSFKEPRLRFGYEELLEDPKDGLLLFGPAEPSPGFLYGVVGTQEGIRQFEAWSQRLERPVLADPAIGSSITFPGFETVFRTPWSPKPRVTLTVDPDELDKKVRLTDPHQRVFDTVDLFAGPIRRYVTEEDPKIALWFVVIPESVWKLCRPHSTLTKKEGIAPAVHLTHAKAMALYAEPDLFADANFAAEKHLYENHFHNQLKAKLLGCEAVTQIIRQTTIAPQEYLNRLGKPRRKMQDNAVRVQNSLDNLHDLNNGGFLAHRSNMESADETEIRNPSGVVRTGCER